MCKLSRACCSTYAGLLSRCVQAVLLAAQGVDLGRDRLPLRFQLADAAALGDVLTDRIGQAQRDRAQHHSQERGAAGEPRPLRLARAPVRGCFHRPPADERGNAARPA